MWLCIDHSLSNNTNPVADSRYVTGSSTGIGYQRTAGLPPVVYNSLPTTTRYLPRQYTTIPTNLTNPIGATNNTSSSSASPSSSYAALKPPTGFQTIITRWGRKLKEYSCSLPVTYIKNHPYIGFYIAADHHGHIVVAEFYRYPGTGAKLPAERDGTIQLLDRIRSIDGQILPKGIDPKEVEKLFLSRLDGRYVYLAMQSGREYQLSYHCPHCHAVNQLTSEIERILRDILIQYDADNKGTPINCFKCKKPSLALKEYVLK